jgi:hypothetical protein
MMISVSVFFGTPGALCSVVTTVLDSPFDWVSFWVAWVRVAFSGGALPAWLSTGFREWNRFKKKITYVYREIRIGKKKKIPLFRSLLLNYGYEDGPFSLPPFSPILDRIFLFSYSVHNFADLKASK